MQVRIYRARYCPAAGDACCDALTKAALDEGRPAFWSFAPYHRTHFVAAACTAKRDGLDRACAQIAQILIRRGPAAAGSVTVFLGLLAPANTTGQRALDEARHRMDAPAAACSEISLEVL
jgi:hypothetical protein